MIRKTLLNSVFFLASLLFTFLVADKFLAVVQKNSQQAYSLVTDELMVHYPDLRKPDATVIYYGAPGAIRTYQVTVHNNSLGFNDREYPIEKKDGEFRIAIIGDSFVEAFQVEQPFASHRVIENILHKLGKNVTVMAFGISGSGQVQQVSMIQEALKYSPDIVIQYILPSNDVTDNLPVLKKRLADVSLFRMMTIFEDKRRIVERISDFILFKWFSNIGLFLSEKVGKIYENNYLFFNRDVPEQKLIYPSAYLYSENDLSHEEVSRAWLATYNALDRTRSMLAVAGVKYLPVILPAHITLEDLKTTFMGSSVPSLDPYKINNRYEAYFKKIGIKYLSLEAVFKAFQQQVGLPVHSLGDGHWNITGHGLAGKEIVRYLLAENSYWFNNKSVVISDVDQISPEGIISIANQATSVPKCGFKIEGKELDGKGIYRINSQTNLTASCTGMGEDSRWVLNNSSGTLSIPSILTQKGAWQSEFSLNPEQASYWVPMNYRNGSVPLRGSVNIDGKSYPVGISVVWKDKLWPTGDPTCLTGNADFPRSSISLVSSVHVDGEQAIKFTHELFDGVVNGSGNPNWEGFSVAQGHWEGKFSRLTITMKKPVVVSDILVVSTSTYGNYRLDAVVVEEARKNHQFSRVGLSDNTARKDLRGLHFHKIHITKQDRVIADRVRLLLGHSDGATRSWINEVYLFGEPID